MPNAIHPVNTAPTDAPIRDALIPILKSLSINFIFKFPFSFKSSFLVFNPCVVIIKSHAL